MWRNSKYSRTYIELWSECFLSFLTQDFHVAQAGEAKVTFSFHELSQENVGVEAYVAIPEDLRLKSSFFVSFQCRHG